jgi:hypothetical protein
MEYHHIRQMKLMVQDLIELVRLVNDIFRRREVLTTD